MGGMCGRYVLFTAKEQLIESIRSETGVEHVDDIASQNGAESIYRQSYNVAPTHTVPVVREFRERLAIGPAQWGYPRGSSGGVIFNARGETAFDKFSFQGSAPCLFVMDGWYEWTGEKGAKQPWYSSRTDGRPLLVAGLCKPFDATVCATIVTCSAREELEWLHHRMPRLLTGEEAMAWLEAPEEDARALARVVPQMPADVISRKADRAVGGVGNNRPELIAPQE